MIDVNPNYSKIIDMCAQPTTGNNKELQADDPCL